MSTSEWIMAILIILAIICAVMRPRDCERQPQRCDPADYMHY